MSIQKTSSICNPNCTICRSVKADLGRKNRFMSFDLFKKIVDEVPLYSITINTQTILLLKRPVSVTSTALFAVP
ncbi:MAG: hypothetical protein HZC52_09865 [Planctomycetes bacterium]|nr:hypothetical protein [Planctomycetota bacterium]